VVLNHALSHGGAVVSFLDSGQEWDGTLLSGPGTFVTAIGAGTTNPDYKPAPFIISSQVDGVPTPALVAPIEFTLRHSAATPATFVLSVHRVRYGPASAPGPRG